MPALSPRYAHDPVLVTLGQTIRRIRCERGLSQEELASLAEIDRSYMSVVERGGQNLGAMTLSRIARALGISMSELMLEARL